MVNNINRDFINTTCIYKINNCNVIKPNRLTQFKLNPVTGLPFTDDEISNIDKQYIEYVHRIW